MFNILSPFTWYESTQQRPAACSSCCSKDTEDTPKMNERRNSANFFENTSLCGHHTPHAPTPHFQQTKTKSCPDSKQLEARNSVAAAVYFVYKLLYDGIYMSLAVPYLLCSPGISVCITSEPVVVFIFSHLGPSIQTQIICIHGSRSLGRYSLCLLHVCRCLLQIYITHLHDRCRY